MIRTSFFENSPVELDALEGRTLLWWGGLDGLYEPILRSFAQAGVRLLFVPEQRKQAERMCSLLQKEAKVPPQILTVESQDGSVEASFATIFAEYAPIHDLFLVPSFATSLTEDPRLGSMGRSRFWSLLDELESLFQMLRSAMLREHQEPGLWIQLLPQADFPWTSSETLVRSWCRALGEVFVRESEDRSLAFSTWWVPRVLAGNWSPAEWYVRMLLEPRAFDGLSLDLSRGDWVSERFFWESLRDEEPKEKENIAAVLLTSEETREASAPAHEFGQEIKGKDCAKNSKQSREKLDPVVDGERVEARSISMQARSCEEEAEESLKAAQVKEETAMNSPPDSDNVEAECVLQDGLAEGGRALSELGAETSAQVTEPKGVAPSPSSNTVLLEEKEVGEEKAESSSLSSTLTERSEASRDRNWDAFCRSIEQIVACSQMMEFGLRSVSSSIATLPWLRRQQENLRFRRVTGLPMDVWIERFQRASVGWERLLRQKEKEEMVVQARDLLSADRRWRTLRPRLERYLERTPREISLEEVALFERTCQRRQVLANALEELCMQRDWMEETLAESNSEALC